MRAVVLSGIGFENVACREVPVPRPGPDQLLCRVDAAGVCTSILKIMDQGANHTYFNGWDPAKFPVILGDEGSLTVVQAGANLAKHYKPGQRFGVQPSCDVPPVNHRERYRNNAIGMVKLAVGYTLGGNLAEYILIQEEVLQAQCLLPLPDEALPYFAVSMGEPISCVISAQERQFHLHRETPHSPRVPELGMLGGGTTIVIGAGPMGLMHAELALRFRPRNLIVCDKIQERLDRATRNLAAKAKQAGVHLVTVQSEQLKATVAQLTNGAGADDIVLAVGIQPVQQAALDLLGKGGVANLFGGLPKGQHTLQIDAIRVHYDEIKVVGSSGGAPSDLANRPQRHRHRPDRRRQLRLRHRRAAARSRGPSHDQAEPGRGESDPVSAREGGQAGVHRALGQGEGRSVSRRSTVKDIMSKTFVGFGFGPIQSALFLFEAHQSGNFSRYVVAEVDAQLVQAVRKNGGTYTINIARKNRIDRVSVDGVELYNPRAPADREKIVEAIAQADEMATALPSVKFFDSGNETSVARMLADGLARRAGRPGIIYAAENHNHAAEILVENVMKHAPRAVFDSVQVLNTVIGKMSGIIAEPEMIGRIGLETMTPATPKAILVEEFSRILISRVTLPGYRRGIGVFVEKDDLLPFEEAKLYGHNAIHALIGYLADLRGLPTMADAAHHPDLMQIARRAFIDESGAALCRKHAALGDPLFTPAGYRAYAEDLLDRMVRPNLNDLVARVIRDPVRKLGYDDRLYGTMRLALRHGIQPTNLAKGAAAAVLFAIPAPLRREDRAARQPDRGDLARLAPRHLGRGTGSGRRGVGGPNLAEPGRGKGDKETMRRGEPVSASPFLLVFRFLLHPLQSHHRTLDRSFSQLKEFRHAQENCDDRRRKRCLLQNPHQRYSRHARAAG